MTNREKCIDEILADVILNQYTDKELVEEKGIVLGQDSRKWNKEVCEWLQSEYKEPEIEYMEVTNDIPRFTEIEVRDSDEEEWIKRLFLARLKDSEYRYVTMMIGFEGYTNFAQARVRKDWDKCKE